MRRVWTRVESDAQTAQSLAKYCRQLIGPSLDISTIHLKSQMSVCIGKSVSCLTTIILLLKGCVASRESLSSRGNQELGNSRTVIRHGGQKAEERRRRRKEEYC